MSDNKDDISLVDVYLKLRETFHFLWLKKISIIIAIIIGGAIGFSYALYKPIEYESELTFIVDQAGGSKGLGALGGIASSFGFGNLGGDGGLYENQVNLMSFIKSRSMMEKALLSKIPGTEQTFAERFINVYGWKEEWNNDPTLKDLKYLPNQQREEFSIAKDSVLYEIYLCNLENEMIKVSTPDDEGNIIAINFKVLDDTLANYFPRVLLNEVSTSYIIAKTKLAKDNVIILQRQTDSVRNELNRALYNTAYQTDEVFGLNPALNVKRVPANKEQIDVRASSVLLEELIKNLELAKVQLKDQTPLIEVIDEPRFPNRQDKPSKLKMILIFSLLSAFLGFILLILTRFFKRLSMELKKGKKMTIEKQ